MSTSPAPICEIVVSHVAVDLGDASETVEHIMQMCPNPAAGIVDDGDDDVTVCAEHMAQVPAENILYRF